MSFVPEIVALDFETKDSNGASLNYYRDDFEVWSLSATWRGPQGSLAHFFSCNPNQIKRFLTRLNELQTPLVVHNLMFEWGCVMAKYPELDLNWHSDTLFLAASYDGGGRTWEEKPHKDWREGLGLEAVASRILASENHNHKKEAHDYLKTHHKVRSKFGAHLDKLPLDILERYNLADTDITLQLYEVLTEELAEIAEDSGWVGWEQPFQFYKGRCKYMAKARLIGVPVKTEECLQYITDIDDQLKDIKDEFREWGGEHIAEIEQKNIMSHVNSVKTPAAQERKRQDIKDNPEAFHINLNSGKQLKELFVDRLGIKPVKLTPGKAPSFKAADMWQWGVGGKILAKIGDRNLVQAQAANIFVDSMYDGRIHPDSKPIGTRTYRIAGGSRED